MLFASSEVVNTIFEITVGGSVCILLACRIGPVGQQKKIVVAISVEFDRNLAVFPTRKRELDRIGCHEFRGDVPSRGTYPNLRERDPFLDSHAYRTGKVV